MDRVNWSKKDLQKKSVVYGIGNIKGALYLPSETASWHARRCERVRYVEIEQPSSEGGIFDLGDAKAGVEEIVIRTPAVYISQHSDVWQGGSGLEGRSRRASMSAFTVTSRRHSVSGIRVSCIVWHCTSSVDVIDGVRQTPLMRGLTLG